MMKPKAFVINTVREGILDENVVTNTCPEGWIAGAAIDVWKFKTEFLEDEEIQKIGSAAVATAVTDQTAFAFTDHQIVIEDNVNTILNDRDPTITAQHKLELALAIYESDK